MKRESPIFLFLFICFEALIDHTIGGYINLNITNIGYNYYVSVISKNKAYNLVIDTNSYFFITQNQPVNSSFTNHSCGWLSADGTPITYYVQQNLLCESYSNLVTFSQAPYNNHYNNISVIVTQYVEVANNKLHVRSGTQGNLGMSYENIGDNLTVTPFQLLLSNLSQTFDSDSNANTFGLNFESNSMSTMQLGGVLDIYSSSISWIAQPINYPSYHLFYLSDLLFCGQNLLSNFSYNWPTIVDTGSVCLTLPAEMYDSLEAWFNNSTIITDLSVLPTISFQYGNNDIAYIPLSNLVINSSTILNETGAPFINYNHDLYRLCILKGASLSTAGSNLAEIDSSRYIVFGSMVMKSIYFAANFETYSVGLANKLSSEYEQSYSICKSHAVCVGEQIYSPYSNSCSEPQCSIYFFTRRDDTTHKCVYSSGAMIFGIFFVSIIIFMETSSYLVTQYTGIRLISRDDVPAGGGNRNERRNYVLYKALADPITLYVGGFLTAITDWFVILLGWVPVAQTDNIAQLQQEQGQSNQYLLADSRSNATP
eukprot:gene5204-7242_t